MSLGQLPKDTTVLIAGASSGIGRATAEAAAKRGFRVFGGSRQIPAAMPSGVRERWIPMDVRDQPSVQAGITTILGTTGRLDAVVCCAGYALFGSVEDVPIEKLRAQLETNVVGTVNVLRASLPHLRNVKGRAVVVGSLAGRAPIPFQAHYSATKAALDALTVALRIEVAPFGVGVSLVEPGDIKTAFNDNTDWGDYEGSPYSEGLRRCERVIRESLPKAPGPEQVAAVILRALTAPRPRVRYTVGPDSILVPFGRRFLPDWLSLSLIRNHFNV
jgi:NAD(P)-dependent dehydrogenase (short-subunit alcohol dehydrogenase family)